MSSRNDSLRTRETREALLEQLDHLRDEVDALRRHVAVIPTEILEGRPLPDDPSFKEIYSLLALFDERVYEPAVSRLSGTEVVQVDMPEDRDLLAEEQWNQRDMDRIVERVRSARAGLVERLASLSFDAWHLELKVDGDKTDVFGLAYAIVQHDVALLRSAAYRLHESRLTSREEDLPK
ncbi:MAG: hypothetical protein WD021_02540 [Rhodothermales bacterium]